MLFLVFTVPGAAATLLEEARCGTLQRLLGSGMGIGRLLLYKWPFFAILGSAQVCMMLVWGWAEFELDLFTFSHFSGFLMMSALGRRMFPRLLMSDTLKLIGLATFNAWALDNYQKVFWHEAPLSRIWPQVIVLPLVSVVLIGAAYWLQGGRRNEDLMRRRYFSRT